MVQWNFLEWTRWGREEGRGRGIGEGRRKGNSELLTCSVCVSLAGVFY